VRQLNETGTFSRRGQVFFHPGGTFYSTTTAGTHQASLSGPPGSDFDLALFAFQKNGAWQAVAQSANPGSVEALLFEASGPGIFVWRVACVSGSGAYLLTFTTPQ
jgi:hypothetical protein